MIVEGGEAVLVGWDGVGALRKGVRDKGKTHCHERGRRPRLDWHAKFAGVSSSCIDNVACTLRSCTAFILAKFKG